MPDSSFHGGCTLAFYHHKGGATKTTHAVNVSCGAALFHDLRVLLVDLDGQASASRALGVKRDAMTPSIANLILTAAPLPLSQVVRSIIPGRLDLITGHAELDNADVYLATQLGRESILARSLLPLRHRYDLIILDTAATKGLLSVNALSWADEIVLTSKPTFDDVDQFAGVFAHLRDISHGLGRVANLLGISISMVPPNSRTARRILSDLDEMYGDLMFRERVRQTVRVSEAPELGMSIYDYAAGIGNDLTGNTASQSFQRLTGEIIDRIRERGYIT
jgi:chromosome partitioning protein